MRRGDKRTIEIDGQKFEAEYLGKGMFSTCYRVENTVYSFTNNDPGKEILNLWVNDSPHTPKLERHDDKGDKQVYSMPYYRTLNSGDPAWEHYKKLKRLLDNSRKIEFGKPLGLILQDNLTRFQDAIENSDLPKELKEAVCDIVSACFNYDKVNIEFAPRNLGVSENGNLILRDIIFKVPERKR